MLDYGYCFVMFLITIITNRDNKYFHEFGRTIYLISNEEQMILLKRKFKNGATEYLKFCHF